MEAKSFLNDYYLTPGRTGKWQIHTPPEAQGEGGGGEVVMEPLPRVLICCLQWKAFDLLNKMRYILWVVALLEAILDFTKNSRNQVKTAEAVTFWCLTYKITHK